MMRAGGGPCRSPAASPSGSSRCTRDPFSSQVPRGTSAAACFASWRQAATRCSSRSVRRRRSTLIASSLPFLVGHAEPHRDNRASATAHDRLCPPPPRRPGRRRRRAPAWRATMGSRTGPVPASVSKGRSIRSHGLDPPGFVTLTVSDDARLAGRALSILPSPGERCIVCYVFCLIASLRMISYSLPGFVKCDFGKAASAGPRYGQRVGIR